MMANLMKRTNGWSPFALIIVAWLGLATTSEMTVASDDKSDAKALGLAVFDFELEDFSAGGPLAGESRAETARLKRVTEAARRLLAHSGRYALVDTASSPDRNLREHWLRKCNGCEADIARELGADQSFVGIVQKLSVLVHTLRFVVRDARTGEVVWNIQTDLRGDTDEAWLRSVKFLMEEQFLAAKPTK